MQLQLYLRWKILKSMFPWWTASCHPKTQATLPLQMCAWQFWVSSPQQQRRYPPVPHLNMEKVCFMTRELPLRVWILLWIMYHGWHSTMRVDKYYFILFKCNILMSGLVWEGNGSGSEQSDLGDMLQTSAWRRQMFWISKILCVMTDKKVLDNIYILRFNFMNMFIINVQSTCKVFLVK